MLTLNDGRSELWQWDTGRTLAVDADCSQVHFSNKVFGRSIDVDVVDGVAIIPDILLQTDKELDVWAFVGTAENGYTKISKTFTVNRRNKPADYVFTPTEQMTLQTIQSQIGDLDDLTTEAKENLVAAINEAAASGGSGSMDLRVADGYVQYSTDGGSTWENLIAIANLKGDPGAPGKDGHSPVVTATKSGKTTTISVDGAAIATVEDGADGAPGSRGSDGITPTIGQNGNWFLGEEDTGKPSRGADGATGATGATGEKGADGKSAYQYAVDGGYTGTESEFSAKLASGALIVHVTGVNGNLSADKTYADIMDAILAGTTVLVDRGELYLPLVSINTEYPFLVFGTTTCVNDDTGKMVYESLIEITQNDEVKDISTLVDIPTTMPNPNALTFTGAVTGSYDGSAPLSVEIPSGGGGSDTWETIIDFELTEDVGSVTFTTDISGNPFSLKEFTIFVVQTPIVGQTTNNRIVFAPNKNGWGGAGNVELKPSPKETEETVYGFIHANTVDGRLNLLTSVVSSNYSSLRTATTESTPRNNYMGNFNIKVNGTTNELIYCEMPLKKINFVGLNSIILGTGSKIVVRGVRT